MSKNLGRSRVGYSERKPRAQGTEMGVKQSVRRSCDCFQDTKTAEKNSFPKTRLLPIFSPDFILWHLARFGCFALKSGFIRKLGTFLEGR